MKFNELLDLVGDLTCFKTRFVAAGQNLAQVRLQLDRWVKVGKLIKLHKGLYTLAKSYQKLKPEPFSIANSLKSASYVSLQSAMSWHGLIPEYVPEVTSITTGRPISINTPVGRFDFRHLKKKLFWGFRQVELSSGQSAFVALPEKALLDLIYFTTKGDSEKYICSLRLQNLEQLNKSTLSEFVGRSGSPKLKRALKHIMAILKDGEGENL